jgi:hypothetical protein
MTSAAAPVHALLADGTVAVLREPTPADEDAVRALSAAQRYAAWRARPAGRVPDLPGVHPDEAKRLVDVCA